MEIRAMDFFFVKFSTSRFDFNTVWNVVYNLANVIKLIYLELVSKFKFFYYLDRFGTVTV